jgi:hypothetical protein
MSVKGGIMPFKRYKEESRRNWGETVSEGEELCRDQIKLGAILRIADSLEKMEKPITRLMDDVTYYKKRNEELKQENLKLAHSRAGLKGYIKNLKNRF